MRKIARESVIFCLLGAAIGSVYFIARQYQSFRHQAASEAERAAACKQAIADGIDTKTGLKSLSTLLWCEATELYTRNEPVPPSHYA
jgi:hypothetical protein